jgi:hypothetical protein
MQIIANFSYAGTSKYVSHAVENDRTICGMNTKELFARSGQEWEYLEEDEHFGVVHKLSARDVGCVKCSSLLTKRTPDLKRAARKSKKLSKPPFQAANASR